MKRIDQLVLDQLALDQIERVTFYKRDELTTDLICCEVEAGARSWGFHEDLPGWELLLAHLQRLPGFRRDWHSAVAHPAFDRSETVAFERI